jgi:transposase InsO family protein
MRRLDELYTVHPFLRSWRMTAMLRAEGLRINRKRVQRLMQRMGIEALGPKPRTTKPAPGHKIYPYLLRDMTIARPNQVWAADITHIPNYPAAVIEWATRAVLAWRLSNTKDSSFCVDALEEALARFGQPEIFNPDRGSQFTGTAFTGVLTPASAGAEWTTSSSSGCGVRSSTRTCISKATPMAARPALASARGSRSTTAAGLTRRSASVPRWQSGAQASPGRSAKMLWTDGQRKGVAHMPHSCNNKRLERRD